MTLAYDVDFQSEDMGAAYLARGNSYVDYWRSLYPSGVAVGTTKFCPDGGCLGLFLNRYDLYQVFKPDLGGSWIEYNGGTFAPTISPAPSAEGGCDNPHNRHLDKCFRKSHRKRASVVAWDSLGPVGQLSVFLVSFMAITLSLSIFLARARKLRKRGESYMGFLVRDVTTGKKRRKKKLRKKKRRKMKNKDLDKDLVSAEAPKAGGEGSYLPPPVHPKSKRARSKSKSRRSRSKSRGGKESERSASKSKRSSSKRRSGDAEGGEKKRSSRSSSRKRSSSRNAGGRRSRSRSTKRERSSSRNRTRSESRRRRDEEEDPDSPPAEEDANARRQLV